MLIPVKQSNSNKKLPDLIMELKDKVPSPEQIEQLKEENKQQLKYNFRMRQEFEHFEAHQAFTKNYIKELAKINGQGDAQPCNVLEITLAIPIYATLKVRYRCKHVSWPIKMLGSPFLIWLTTQTLTCLQSSRCLEEAQKLWKDDKICEGCKEKADFFYPVMAAYGPMIARMELCESCHKLIMK